MVVRAIQEAQMDTAVGSSAVVVATAGVAVAARAGYPVADLLVGCEVPPVECGGNGGHSVGQMFRGRCDLCGSPMVRRWETVFDLVKVISGSLLEASGERGAREELLLALKRMTGWAMFQELLGFLVDTEAMTISLPRHEVDDLVERLET